MSSAGRVRALIRRFFEDNAIPGEEDQEDHLLADHMELLASTLERELSLEEDNDPPLSLAPRIDGHLRATRKMLLSMEDMVDAERAIKAANTMLALILKAKNVPI
jgi:hypothetical protein